MFNNGKKSTTFIEKTLMWVSISIACLIVFFATNRLRPKYLQWRSLTDKVENLDNKLKEIKLASLEVRDNIVRFDTDRDFVEEQARRARMVTENDLVFVFD